MSQSRTALTTLLNEKANRLSGGLYHRMQIDFAYNSNHIEGSRLTHDQTRYIFETHTVDGTARVDDILETANHFKCFDYILDNINESLSESYIKKLHKILKNGLLENSDDGVIIGDYKKYPNEVAEIETVHPDDVHIHIDKLIKNFNAKQAPDIYDIAEFHAIFEKIHPFYDGNGRIGRLLILKMCLQNNITPFIINDNDKIFYYMGLKEWQVDGKKERLLDVFLSMQDDMKAVLDYFKIDYDKADIKSSNLILKHGC